MRNRMTIKNVGLSSIPWAPFYCAPLLYYTLALAGRAFRENNACSHQSWYTAVHHNTPTPPLSHNPQPNPSFSEYGGLKTPSRSTLKEQKKGQDRTGQKGLTQRHREKDSGCESSKAGCLLVVHDRLQGGTPRLAALCCSCSFQLY